MVDSVTSVQWLCHSTLTFSKNESDIEAKICSEPAFSTQYNWETSFVDVMIACRSAGRLSFPHQLCLYNIMVRYGQFKFVLNLNDISSYIKADGVARFGSFWTSV